MNISSAHFVSSSPTVAKCPASALPEVAFIGRSNVGKSSLINMLTGRRALAKTSSTPGKTMLINHFLVDGFCHIVDLPGYGYAQRSKEARSALRRMIEQYVLRREQLVNLFVLIDLRHAPQAIDLQFIDWLGENGVPFSIVFTKADKISASAVRHSVEAYCAKLLETWEELPPIFITSSSSGRGRQELLDYIAEIVSDCTTNPKNDNTMNKNGKTVAETTAGAVRDVNAEAADRYPGAAIDVADDERVSAAAVKDYTSELNNNPCGTDED